MELLKYMNSHENWEEELQAAPYNLTVSHDGDYILLKYNQIESDFNEPMVCEARGCIIRWSQVYKEYFCACRAFDKFFNDGDPHCARLEDGIYATEKIDGSLIKLWYDRGKWRLSTNGSIDAFKVTYGDMNGETFGELFESILGYSVQELGKKLEQRWVNSQITTFCFELTSRKNRVVLEYDDAIWFIGAFVLPHHTDVTLKFRECASRWKDLNFKFPKIYKIHSLAQAERFIKKFNKNGELHEGIVLSDASGCRIKVKTEEYFNLHFMTNNHVITVRRILRMAQEEILDDFLEACPWERERVELVLKVVDKYLSYLDNTLIKVKPYFDLSVKEFMLKTEELEPYARAYVRGIYKGKIDRASTYFWNLTESKKVEIVRKELENG